MSRCYIWAEHTPAFLPDATAYAIDEDGNTLRGHVAPTPDQATRELKTILVRGGRFEGDIEIVPPPVYDHDGWMRAALRAKPDTVRLLYGDPTAPKPTGSIEAHERGRAALVAKGIIE